MLRLRLGYYIVQGIPVSNIVFTTESTTDSLAPHYYSSRHAPDMYLHTYMYMYLGGYSTQKYTVDVLVRAHISTYTP